MWIALTIVAVVLAYLYGRRKRRSPPLSQQSAWPPGLRPTDTEIQATRLESPSRPGVWQRPPPPPIARWRVQYVDHDGQVTDRDIRVNGANVSGRKIKAFCEARQALRTFTIDGLRKVTDLESGQAVDLEQWLKQYEKERREERRAARQERAG